MKNKIIGILLTFITLTSVYADEGYNIGWYDPGNGSTALIINGGKGGQGFTTLKPASLNFSVLSTSIRATTVPLSFAVYTYDGIGRTIIADYHNIQAGDLFSVNVDSNAQVGFLFNTGDSIIDTITSNGNYYGVLVDPQQFNMKFHVNDSDWSNHWSTVIAVNADVPAPAGAPMPSTSTTLFLAGVIFVGIMCVKRYRNK